jgi:hypothetical protein
MNRFKTLASIIGIVSLLMIFSVSNGLCWNYPMPSPMMGTPFNAGNPMGGPGAPPTCGPVQGPPMMAPCGPKAPCPKIGLELGGRAFYSTNFFTRSHSVRGALDFIADLNFSRNTLVGEIFGALRYAPWFAGTYTYMFPRIDHGNGILPADIVVGGTLFPVGTPVTAKSTVGRHLWELEFYPWVDCDFRVGPYMMFELWVNKFEMEGTPPQVAPLSDQETFTEFYMGIGLAGEYAPSNILFFRAKGAWTFLQMSNGIYAEGGARYFPELGNSEFGGDDLGLGDIRPYIGAGYRYRYIFAKPNENEKNTVYAHGPYGEFGIIF